MATSVTAVLAMACRSPAEEDKLPDLGEARATEDDEVGGCEEGGTVEEWKRCPDDEETKAGESEEGAEKFAKILDKDESSRL